MILSYNVSLYGLVFFSLSPCFFSLLIYFGLLGAPPGRLCWGISVPQTPCQCPSPSQNKILDPPLLAVTSSPTDLFWCVVQSDEASSSLAAVMLSGVDLNAHGVFFFFFQYGTDSMLSNIVPQYRVIE